MSGQLSASQRACAAEMIRLRYWQHVMNEELKQKRFTVPIHVAIGHEAIAVAIHQAMTPDDQLVLTHRNMAYNLLRAGALEPVQDAYRLLPTGVAGGRLGSMNLANPERGVLYASSILGNNLSVACGLALGKQVRQQPGVVIVLTGDGAMEEGPFYESLVIAASHRLPVLVVVENNNYSMSSTIAQRRCPIAVDRLCAAVELPYQSLRGNDGFAYAPVIAELRSRVAAGGPACVEVELGALTQHAGPTPGWPTDPKSISLERGLVVEQTANDPLFVLQQRLGDAAFAEACDAALAEEPMPYPVGAR